MDEERTYTLDEIEERTGFDKRTIAYYVQEGLLPKVGRRGPKTRYPRQFLDRLMFIKKTRELQDRGLVGTMTLGEIKDLFDQFPDQLIRDILAGKEPAILPDNQGAVARLKRMSSPRSRAKAAARRIQALSDEVKSDSEAGAVRFMLDASVEEPLQAAMRISQDVEIGADPDRDGAAYERGSRAYMRVPSLPPEEELRRALRDLLQVLRADDSDERKLTERWTRVRVASGLYLSVEGLDEDGEYRLGRAARLLRKLLLEDDRDL